MLCGLENFRVRHWTNRAVLAAAIGLFLPGLAIAQVDPPLPLSQILPNLFGNTIVLAPRSTPDVPSHSAHFKPSPEQLRTPEQFNQQMVTLLSTFPFGSSSGGFTYTYDPSLGTFSRSSESFGPLFAERALTIGRERGSLGVAYQRSTYDTFEGKNLRQREINFYIQHTDCCGKVQNGVQVPDGTQLNPAFEGDIIEAALSLDLTTDTVVFSATYGLTDRLDLGVAVPLVAVSVDASIRARIERLATAANPDLHVFEGDNPDEHIYAVSGHAAGLGDIMVRAKYNFLTRRGGGLAAALDVRTPTGDESNLLGTGALQAKLYGIASIAFGKLSPHLNAGYTRTSHGALPDVSLNNEWNYTAGFDLAVSPRLTLITDVIGRSIRNQGRLIEADRVFDFVEAGPGNTPGTGGGGGGGGGGSGSSGTTPPRIVEHATRREFRFEPGNLNLAVGNTGVRFNPFRKLLVSANLLFALTEAGLRDRVTPVISIDYAF
jgi:outer membrane putative beta-barrel porin/alpha-amylase